MLHIKIQALLSECRMRCSVEGKARNMECDVAWREGARNMECDVLDAKKEETTLLNCKVVSCYFISKALSCQ